MGTGKNKGNLLCELVPEARAFFDFEKNEGIDFNSLTVGSRTKCHWKCQECGRVRFAAVRGKVKKAKDGSYRFSGCRECFRKQLHEKNSLIALFPEAKDYFDFDKNQGIDFDLLTIGSRTKCHWKCPECGRARFAAMRDIVKKEKDGSYRFSGCGKCNKKQLHGENRLIALLPEVKNYFDFDKNQGIDFESLTVGSETMCYWRCPECGREQFASVHVKVIKNKDGSYRFRDCFECAQKQLHEKNRLVDLLPETRDCFDFEKNKQIDFESLSIASTTKCYWKCPDCGGEQYASVYAKVEKNKDGSYRFRTCSCCGKKRASRQGAGGTQENGHSLLCVDQVEFLKKQWNTEKNPNLDPSKLAVNSAILANWVCKNCRHEWRARINRVYNSLGKCPACEGRNTIVPGVTDVFSLVPQAKEYYCFDKNENIDITHLGVASSTEVWWRCPNCGNERKCAIKNKVKKNGDGTYSIRTCNKCVGKTDNGSRLANNSQQKKKQYVSDNANIMKFWDWEQNKELDSSIITSSSRKQLAMKCPKCGYSWVSRAINLRGCKGTCPCCDERRVIIPGVNDLFTLVPGIKEYYDFDKNKDVDIKTITISSRRRVYWKCPWCQDETYSSLSSKIRKVDEKYVFNKCKRCHGKGLESALTKNDENDFDIQDSQNKLYSDYGERSLAAMYPQVAVNWSPNNQRPANSVLPDSAYDALWKCSSCHFDYLAKVCDAVNGYAECPFCSNRRAKPGYNTVEDAYPDLAKRWSSNNHLKANEVLATSSFNALWICNSCGGEHRAPVKDMAAGIADCPFCANRRPLPGYNSFADKFPELAKRWAEENPGSPTEHLSNSEYVAKWKCPECYGIFSASIADVVRGIDECPYCAGKQVLSGYNSFDIRYPNLLKEWDPIRNYAIDLDPRSISDRMAKEVWWICSQGHKYRMRLFRRVLFEKRGKDACPICKGYRRERRHFV